MWVQESCTSLLRIELQIAWHLKIEQNSCLAALRQMRFRRKMPHTFSQVIYEIIQEVLITKDFYINIDHKKIVSIYWVILHI
ncbi:hypothetical protein D3C86_1891580 [compost metagenome]